MKIRTTMQPDVELDVDQAEYTDLQRQGLIVEKRAAVRQDAPPTDSKET